MSITYVASSVQSVFSATSVSASDPAGTQEDDFYIAVCTHVDDANVGTWATPAGWTKVAEEHYSTAGSADLDTAVFRRFRGASAVGSTTFETSSGTNDEIAVTISAYRGVDTTTPLDVAYVTADHYQTVLNNANGTNKPIATATNDARVVLVWTGSDNNTAGTAGQPSGYALDLDFNDRVHCARFLASKAVSTQGTETPGAWTHTGFSAGVKGQLYTFALRPEIAPPETRHIPDMESLYYGTTRLDSKTGITYAVISGHTNITDIEPLGTGSDMTTNATGVPQFPGVVSYGALSDPVTVLMYWEEGSDPVVDRSIIVKTTLVEDA